MAPARRSDRATIELAFLIGGQTHTVRADRVVEILRTPPITRVPLVPAGIAGVINFHGLAIPLLRLDVPLTDGKAQPLATGPRVIVYADPEPVGLLVDAIVTLGESKGKSRGAKGLDVARLVQGLLGDAPPTGATARGAAGAASARSSTVESGRTLLSFLVGGQRYALPLDSVREVMLIPAEISQTPGGDAAVIGLANIRDAVVPLISLAQLLGLDAGAAESKRHVVVTAMGAWIVGLVTEGMDRVLRLADTAIEPVPEVLQRGAGVAELDGIGRLDGGRQLVAILSTAKLFGNKTIADAVQRVDQGGAAMPTASVEAATEQFVVLLLGDERYGLPIGAVDEIIQLPDEVTRLPRAPAFLAGVVNLRGTPLPVIDQRKRFDAHSTRAAQRARVVVVTVDDMQAGFIVDGVSEIVRVPSSEIRAAPRLPVEQSQAFDRATPLGDNGQMLLLIDPKELLSRAERDLLSHLKVPEPSAGS